jgi:hypothetical protein
MPHVPIYERRMRKFMRKPPSVRTAASVVVGMTTFIVVISGIVMHLLDHVEFPNSWIGIW